MTESIPVVGDAAAENERRSDENPASSFAVIAVVVLGTMVGVNTVLTYTMGIFIAAFNEAFGWSRADISFSMTWYTIVAFLGTALIGKLADRLNPGRLAGVSLLAFGLSLIAVPMLIHSIATLWLSYFLLAVIGLGTSPVVLLKPVVAAFSSRRGLAIGLALAGGGLGAFAAPQLATLLIERGGWQLAYVGLGCFAIAVAPALWFVLGRRSAPGRASSQAPSPAADIGLTFRDAFRTREFWLLSGVALCVGLGLAGPAAHLIPFLRDYSVTAGQAAAFASMLGIGGIAGRVIAGFTFDKVKGPLAGLPFLFLGSASVAVLFLFGVKFAGLGAFLLGFAIGSEIDLLAYFTSRYFGLRAHATIFGWTYGIVAFGAATSPVIVGALRDSRGDYSIAFAASAVAMLMATLICTLLGDYRFPARVGKSA